MVISLKASERNVGNRGFKSVACLNSPASHNYNHVTVKEQRVDGSCIGLNTFKDDNVPMLRCTLMGFERSYQINNPSKQIFKYSTEVSTNLSKNSSLNPWFISGFTDAEGSFIISIVKDPYTRTG